MDGQAVEFRADPVRLRWMGVRVTAWVVLAWLLMQGIDVADALWRQQVWQFRVHWVLTLMFAVIAARYFRAYRRIRVERAGVDDGRVFIPTSDLLGPPERRTTRFGGDVLRIPVRSGIDRPVRSLGGTASIPLDAYAAEDRPRIVAAVADLFVARQAGDSDVSPEAVALAATRHRYLEQRVVPQTFAVSPPAVARILAVYTVAIVLASALAGSIPVFHGMDPGLLWAKLAGNLYVAPVLLAIYAGVRLRAIRLEPSMLSAGGGKFHLAGIAGPIDLRPGRWWREASIDFDYDYHVLGVGDLHGRRIARRRHSIGVGQLAPADQIALRNQLAAIARELPEGG